jgi:hypothetical protein
MRAGNGAGVFAPAGRDHSEEAGTEAEGGPAPEMPKSWGQFCPIRPFAFFFMKNVRIPHEHPRVSMAEISQQSWTDYSVGKIGTRNDWFGDDCKQLTVVSHVCHVLTALDVLRTGSIKPQLIYDKSRLNTERILVVWLSPNDWSGAGGFRYGNILFNLDWAKLITDKRFYWVGVAEYKPRACRILLTEKERDGQLLPYSPRNGDGPWWDRHKENDHRWNGKFCLEVMLEEEIRLSDIKELKFVGHHSVRCSMKNQGCRDKGQDAWTGGARLLAGACDRQILSNWPYLWTTKKGNVKESLQNAWQKLSGWISEGIMEWDGPVKAGSQRAPHLARAALGALCDLSEQGRKHLFSLFDSEDSAVEACAAVIESDLDLKPETLPRSYQNVEF